MSRRPPIPPASQPTHGPDAVPKRSVDITHRVRRRARQVSRAKPPELSQADFSFWTLTIAGAAAAGIVWWLIARQPSAA